MKAEKGSLLFIRDFESAKKRPYICVHVFTNTAGVAYDWLVIPITSTVCVGMSNLILVRHSKLSTTSYAKISNVRSISWNDEIELSKIKFDPLYVRDVCLGLGNILRNDKDE